MSTIKISKERVGELLKFLSFEKEYFIDMHGDADDEYLEITIKNFDDTIAIVKSVFEAWN